MSVTRKTPRTRVVKGYADAEVLGDPTGLEEFSDVEVVEMKKKK